MVLSPWYDILATPIRKAGYEMPTKNLKSAGLKVTLPRTKILQILEQGDGAHLSAEEIHNRLVENGDDIGLATIYRVLTQFETADLVIRHNFGDGKSVFELNLGIHHDHLVCIKCGNVFEFVDPVIEQQQKDIAKQYNFQITDHSLYIFGICQNCNV